jgi:CelD/BcsL family acetyltransferase involved in cellulose biosynthesis
MRIETFSAVDMPSELLARWRDAQQANPAFAGPCFHPLLFQSVAQHVPGVRVAVLTKDSGSGAFLPYLQVPGERIARPVPACDYQGIVAREGESWDMRKILRRLGLLAWEFDNLLPTTGAFQPDFAIRARSQRVALDGGIDAYLAGQRNAGKSGRKLKMHRRFLQRDRGPLRFVAQSSDPAALAELLRWKADRFRGFADWAGRTIELIHSRQDGELSGVLSALYAGDSLVAAHFGIRCDGVLHYWFPAFNPDVARYSASRLLLEDLIAELPSLQCDTLDLGPGGEPYKDYFANASIEVCTGAYELPSFRAYARRLQLGLRKLVKSSPRVYGAALPIVRFFRKVRGSQTGPK